MATLMQDWAAEGLRVLAVATRPLPQARPSPLDRDDVERDLTLLGLVAMSDTPRPEVPDAVESCHRAGLRLIWMTSPGTMLVASRLTTAPSRSTRDCRGS